jgi:hypothetical protein
VLYRPGQAPEIFGKCRVTPALNIQIPYYEKDDKAKGTLQKVKWINLKAKNEEEQLRIAKRIAIALNGFPNGGKQLENVIEFIIKTETDKGNLLKDDRTNYEWPSAKPENLYPKGEPKPPIPPEPKKP